MTRVEPALGCNHADGALTLATLPYAFTQDDLLTSDEFLPRAEEYGHRVTLNGLQELHNHRLLVPLYRVSDTAVEGRRVPVASCGL